MNRKATRQQVETAVTPMLTKGEQLQRSGPAWAVEQRGKAPLLFRERDLHEVVLTNQRLILLTRPRRRRPLGVNNLVLAKRFSTFSLERARRLRPMLQLQVRTTADRILVLEFRPRDRRVARDLAAALGPSGDGGSHPVTPTPAAPAPARLEPATFEPPPPAEEGVAVGKPSRKETRRARKESKRATKAQTSAGEAAPERRERPDRRKRSDGPPGGFERRGGRDRRSGWADAKPSRKQRRQARKDKKGRGKGSGGEDILDLLAP